MKSTRIAVFQNTNPGACATYVFPEEEIYTSVTINFFTIGWLFGVVCCLILLWVFCLLVCCFFGFLFLICICRLLFAPYYFLLKEYIIFIGQDI